MSAGPRIAVVIATRNRRASLLAVLARLRELPERPRLVVVDNASRDGTPAAVHAAAPEATVVELQENRGASARTAGVLFADEPYVAFCDDDSWWEPGSLDRAARLLDADERLALVAARVLVGPDEREDDVCAVMATSGLPAPPGLPGRPVLGFVACGCVVRREAFLAAGGFHARLGVGGEEQLLATDLQRLGWRLAYVPSVVAHHHPSPERDVARRRIVELRNRLWFAWLRRSARVAMTRTFALAARASTDRIARAALAEAARGLPWVVLERRSPPRELEAQLALVD
jgi:N-acetylglucosaminyl-diphospho-decaprenol L-rhamnosyltransferase